jgi:molybdate transport system regulatory protein
MKIDGRFWLTKKGKSFLGSGRIELLERIDRTGSIHAAAKEMKMSYKAAWERINSMNEMSDQPIITRTKGGRGGGGTVLTPYAHELIATFKRFNELHRQFIDRFAEAGSDPEHLARILSRTFLTTSARNQLPAKVADIEINDLHATLTLALNESDTLRSTITVKSVKSMGLVIGCEAFAVIKSSDIQIVAITTSTDKDDNTLAGTVESIEISGENVEIAFRLKGGTLLVALEKSESAQNLEVGSLAFAVISPLHIMIGL